METRIDMTGSTLFRAGPGWLPAPRDNHEDPQPAETPAAAEPENPGPAAEPNPERAESPAPPDTGALIFHPPRPAERRAQEFLPQWLKRHGRAWPG